MAQDWFDFGLKLALAFIFLGIERLRNSGHLICNLGDGSGYFIAETANEYIEFRQRYGSHAFPIMETIRSMDGTARDKFPNPLQPSLL